MWIKQVLHALEARIFQSVSRRFIDKGENRGDCVTNFCRIASDYVLRTNYFDVLTFRAHEAPFSVNHAYSFTRRNMMGKTTESGDRPIGYQCLIPMTSHFY